MLNINEALCAGTFLSYLCRYHIHYLYYHCCHPILHMFAAREHELHAIKYGTCIMIVLTCSVISVASFTNIQVKEVSAI
jgi:hypothetical protein